MFSDLRTHENESTAFRLSDKTVQMWKSKGKIYKKKKKQTFIKKKQTL